MPFLQSLDDSEEFSVVDIIISFGGGESGRVVSARMKVSVRVLLHEYSPGGSKGGVSHDKKQLGSVQHFDHRCQQECFLELDEGFILFTSPIERYPLLGQINE